MAFRLDGSFKQRARTAEKTSKQLKDVRRQKVAIRTREAIDEFEEHLKRLQEDKIASIDDLPIAAEAGHLRDLMRSRLEKERQMREAGSDTSSLRGPGHGHEGPELLRTQSAQGPELDARYDQRPPSPLGLYDYGSISTRPRSVLAQRSREAGESMRSMHRQSTPGFYAPGLDFRHGPYGFSMLDPIHMPSRTGQPARPGRDPGDVRPATTEGRSHRHMRSRTCGPVISDGVKSAGLHDKRAARVFGAIDRVNEESSLEQARFEHGVFEGRWRDPLLEPSTASSALAPPQHPRCNFLSHEDAGENGSRAQQVASKILFGIEGALRQNRSTLGSIFRGVNKGTVGVLEPQEFLEGLEKSGAVKKGTLTDADVVAAMATIDPHFDGRVNFTTLERAVASARGVQRQRAQEATRFLEHQHKKVINSYGESLPFDVVKVERQPKSLFNFERAFERFRQQQKELLAHHGETSHWQ